MSNEKYKGSIELISGLVQKNNGDFPLMEANAVAFYEEVLDEEGKPVLGEDGQPQIEEIRLTEKIKRVGISEKEKEQLLKDAISATTNSESYKKLNQQVTENTQAVDGASTNIKQNAEDIVELKTSVQSLNNKVDANSGDNENLIVQYNEKGSKLYLYEKDPNGKVTLDDGTIVNLLSETIVTGGAGGSGTTATYRLSLKVDGKESFSILENTPALLKYTIVLKQAVFNTETNETEYIDVTNERVTYSIYKDNVFQRDVPQETVKSGEIDVTDLLSLGVNNFKITATVSESITVKDPDSGEETIELLKTSSTARWGVNVLKMELEVPDAAWEAEPKYAAASFIYTPIGALNKTIHFILDGKEIHQETTMLNGTSTTYTIPMQSHGVHTFEVYCEGTVEGETIKTDIYKYVLMFIDSKNTTTPLIRIKAPTSAEQYSTSRIYFNIYDPMDETIDRVEVYENDVLKNIFTNNIISAKEHYWDYKPQTPGEAIIKFKYFDAAEESVKINVAEFPYKVSPTLGDLMVDFIPTGRTNQDLDYNVFKNNAFTVVEGEDGQTTTEEIPMSWNFSENFDWINGGWKTDENGDAYFCVKAGTTVDFNYNLFDKENTIAKKDANGNYSIAGTGKEFKLIFKTSNVARSDATWLSCMANASNDQPTGIEMTAHNAYVKSNFDTLEIPYSEEDIIEFDMNIVPITQFSEAYEPEFTSKVIPMIMTYEDGTPVQPKVITNPATSFKQVSAVPITIGSEYCDVHIYRLKIYERYLSEAEILNNFIADSRSGEEMSKRYKRNQIYYTGQSSFAGKEQDLIALAEACPDLRVYLLSAPYFTNHKNDKVKETTIKQWYFKNGKDSIKDNWVATGATHRGQGTSSNEYGYSGRNLDFDMKKAEITLGDNTTKVSKISLTDDSVPTNYLNYKANIASSENANNALLAKRYDRYLPYETLAAINNPKTKNSMEFFNCVVFIQETNEDLSTHREFNDTNIHFYGIGNIGDSKKTDSSRLNDKDDLAEFCVEIMDWNRHLSTFPADTMMNAMSFTTDEVTGEKNYVWAKDENLGILYELVNGKYQLTKDTTVDYNKVYYVDILEHDDFSEDYTYGWRYITEYEKGDEVDGVEITEEQADELNEAVQAPAREVWKNFYRFITRDLTNAKGEDDPNKVAAWKTEFKDWFILDSALYYYLFTLRYTMVDNRAKNSFYHYGKCPDGKYRFEFWDYDNDTALGIDNAGKLEIPFGVEDADTDAEGAPYFRAHNSTFFTRVAKYFAAELNEMWTRVEQNTALGNGFDSTNFINEFDTWQSQFPEELWRLDYERKYKRPYVGGEGKDWDNALPKIVDGEKVTEKRYLTEMMNGKKKYQRRQFERNQDFYMSSKFYGSKNYSNSITLRGSGGSAAHKIPADYTLKITPFSNMYLNLHDGTNTFYHQRVYAGQEYSINLLDTLSVLDLLYIRGASNLQSLGDLSLLYLQTATLGAGSRLKNVTLGNKDSRYSNDALKTLEVGASNKLLEELDIRNLSKLSSTDLPVTGIPSLKRVYAQGSNISTARFANNGLLEEAYLPATITQLQLRNLYFLKTLEVESYANLTDLTIENCASVDSLAIIEQAPKLNTARLIDVEWQFETTDVLNRLYEIDSTITGFVYVDAGRIAEKEKYAAKWPELQVEFGRTIQQWNLNFYNDGADPAIDEPLFSYKIDTNTPLYPELHDPILNGMMVELPTKPDSEDGQYTYKFKTWNPSMEPTINANGEESYIIVRGDMNFFATYDALLRKYTVTWYGHNNEVLKREDVEYGADGVYDGAIPSRSNITDAYYIFGGWDSSSANITGNKDIRPIWLEANPGNLVNTNSEEMEAVEVYSLAAEVRETGYNYTDFDKYLDKGQKINVQMGYMPDFENVESKVFTQAMKQYNGLRAEVVTTDATIFDPNQSFTIALDFTMKYVENKSNVVMACRAADGRGFRLYSASNVPTLQWHSASGKGLYPNNTPAATPTSENREICVIRYEAGSNNLYLYSNNRYSMDDVYEQILSIAPDINWGSFNSPLVFGGGNGDSSSMYFTGEIHYAKLWYGDLGADECKKICSWVYETMEFEQADKQRYNENSTQRVVATFVASQLLDKAMPFYNKSVDGYLYPGWQGSDLRAWINKKIVPAFSPEWQQVLCNTVLSSLGGTNPTGLTKLSSQADKIAYYNRVDTNEKVFIPAYLETMGNPDDGATGEVLEKYKQDKGTNADILPSFAIFTDDNSRIKTMRGTNAPANWWTRTPWMQTQYDNSFVYMKVISQEGTSKNYWYQAPGASSSSTFYGTYPYGVLLAFSI